MPQPMSDLDELVFNHVQLEYCGMAPGDGLHGLVPYYRFNVLAEEEGRVGFIHLRFGDTEHVLQYAGHVGFGIAEEYRGHRYAYQACMALAAFAAEIQPAWIITCDVENTPSRRTIERLGVEFLGEVSVPPDDPHYREGGRLKRRYRWLPAGASHLRD